MYGPYSQVVEDVVNGVESTGIQKYLCVRGGRGIKGGEVMLQVPHSCSECITADGTMDY